MLKFFNFIGSIALAVYVVVYTIYAWTIMFPVELVKVVFGYECYLQEEQEKQ